MRFEIGDREIDGDDYFVVIEPVFFSVSIYDGPDRYEKDLARFSNEQRFILACHWYCSEVNNGGHDQFYWNSTGIVWQDALKGFREIGLSDAAEIIQDSARRFGGEPSLDRDERQKQLDSTNAQFDDLDERLFRLQETVDFDKYALDFMRTHRQRFYFSGVVEKPS